VGVINGHNNHYVGQQIFYIYNEQPLKQLPNKEILDGYVVTPEISAHKLHPRKLTWNKARQACVQEGGKKNTAIKRSLMCLRARVTRIFIIGLILYRLSEKN